MPRDGWDDKEFRSNAPGSPSRKGASLHPIARRFFLGAALLLFSGLLVASLIWGGMRFASWLRVKAEMPHKTVRVWDAVMEIVATIPLEDPDPALFKAWQERCSAIDPTGAHPVAMQQIRELQDFANNHLRDLGFYEWEQRQTTLSQKRILAPAGLSLAINVPRDERAENAKELEDRKSVV